MRSPGKAALSEPTPPAEARSVFGSEQEDQCLEAVCSWLESNPHINAWRDDAHLLYFLRSCKYDLERTKKKITSFYLMKAERTEWFTKRDPLLPEIQELLELGVFLPLKEKDDKNRQVVVIRTAAHDPKRHEQNDVFKVGKMILDLLLTIDNDISKSGIVAIFDMKGVSLGHGLQMKPTIIKHSVESWQIYPCKVKMLEFVNSPIYINFVLNTFRLFMSSKMKSRLIVRSSTSQIKAKLPKELGGNGDSYAQLAQYWKRIVEANAELYIQDEKYKTILPIS